SRGSRKNDLLQALILACAVVIANLFSWNPMSLVAADAIGIEALLELDPLDWSSIDPEKVVEECTLALAKKPKLKEDQLFRIYFLRGIALNFDGKADGAIRDLTEALNLHPNDYRALRSRGQIYGILRQQDKARADFEKIVKLQPTSGIGYAGLALCSTDIGDIDSGKKFAEKAIALDPDEPQGYLARSLAHLSEHNVKPALKDINQCIALSYGGGTPQAATPFIVRAAVFLDICDNPTKAFPNLRMARRLNRSDVAVKGAFCDYYFKTGKYNMAFQISEQLMKEQPNRPDLLGMRVTCLIERNRHEEALQVAESIIRQEPRRRSYLHRGQVFFTQKKYKDALQDYDKSLALRRDTLGAMGAKAYLLAACPDEQFRDGPMARTLAARCCERTENLAPRYLMLQAMACAECGDYKEATRLAKESLKKADSSFPFLADYRRRLALFEAGKPHRFAPDSRTFDYLFP